MQSLVKLLIFDHLNSESGVSLIQLRINFSNIRIFVKFLKLQPRPKFLRFVCFNLPIRTVSLFEFFHVEDFFLLVSEKIRELDKGLLAGSESGFEIFAS